MRLDSMIRRPGTAVIGQAILAAAAVAQHAVTSRFDVKFDAGGNEGRAGAESPAGPHQGQRVRPSPRPSALKLEPQPAARR